MVAPALKGPVFYYYCIILIEWAEDWFQRADPTADGIGGVFEQIAEVTDWT